MYNQHDSAILNPSRIDLCLEFEPIATLTFVCSNFSTMSMTSFRFSAATTTMTDVTSSSLLKPVTIKYSLHKESNFRRYMEV